MTARKTQLSKSIDIFEWLSVIAIIASGVWFLIDSWGTLEPSGRVWVGTAAIVGIGSAASVIPFSRGGHHAFAATASIVAVLTPTGFAYAANILMVIVAVIEIVRIRSKRTQDSEDSRGLRRSQIVNPES